MNFEEWAKKFSAKWYSGDAEKAWKAAQPQWQPIETAPKDKRILMMNMHWNIIQSCIYTEELNFNPTHWMPIPTFTTTED